MPVDQDAPIPGDNAPGTTQPQPPDLWNRLSTPLIVGVIAATVTGLLAIANSFLQSRSNIELEREKQAASLVLKALDPPDQKQRAEGLKFLVEVGLLKDKDGLIKKYSDGGRPVPQIQDSNPRAGVVDPKVTSDVCQILQDGNQLYLERRFEAAIEKFLTVQKIDKLGQSTCAASVYATVATIYELTAAASAASDRAAAVERYRLSTRYNRAFANALMCQYGNCSYANKFWSE